LDSVIILENIEKTFKLHNNYDLQSESKIHEIKSIDNISMCIKKGTMVGIIGKNGGGKTTLLRLISGVYSPDKGKISIIGKLSPLLQVGVGSNGEYTVKENIVFNGLLLGLKKEEILKKITEILKFAELEQYESVKMKYLSSGMKIRIMFSTAMTIDPDILLIDEIISVGDVSFREKSFKKFLSFKENKKTIILVSHNLPMIQKLCDEVYALDKGKIIASGDPKSVIQKYLEYCK